MGSVAFSCSARTMKQGGARVLNNRPSKVPYRQVLLRHLACPGGWVSSPQERQRTKRSSTRGAAATDATHWNQYDVGVIHHRPLHLPPRPAAIGPLVVDDRRGPLSRQISHERGEHATIVTVL